MWRSAPWPPIRVVSEAAPHVVRMELGFLEECRNVVIVEPVLDLVVFPTNRFHKTAIPEQSELVRYRRLRNADRDGEITNTQRSPDQRVEDLGPGGIAKRGECLHHELEDLFFGQTCLSIGNRFGVDRRRCNRHAVNIPEQLFRYSGATNFFRTGR